MGSRRKEGWDVRQRGKNASKLRRWKQLMCWRAREILCHLCQRELCSHRLAGVKSSVCESALMLSVRVHMTACICTHVPRNTALCARGLRFAHGCRLTVVADEEANCDVVLEGPSLKVLVVATEGIQAGQQLCLPAGLFSD